jgi:hypothetical protein
MHRVATKRLMLTVGSTGIVPSNLASAGQDQSLNGNLAQRPSKFCLWHVQFPKFTRKQTSRASLIRRLMPTRLAEPKGTLRFKVLLV